MRITNHIPDQKGFIPDGAKVLPAEMLDHLPLVRVTVAERLQKAGYATGFFGKWHLAGRAGPEGGIRVSLVVRWPAHVRPGSVCSTPVIRMDFYPAILDAAGISQDASEPHDGESLMPLLKQAGDLKRQAIYYPNYAFHRSNRLGSAVRRGDYKLIEFFDDASVELYNLRDDGGETQDLSTKWPEVAASLRSELVRWREVSGAAMPRRADHGGAETPSGDGRD